MLRRLNRTVGIGLLSAVLAISGGCDGDGANHDLPASAADNTGGGTAASTGANQQVAISVLSTRADLVSGGQALVELDLPQGADAQAIYVSANGTNQSNAFSWSADGKYMGLVTGLSVGSNTISVSGPGIANSGLTVFDHPAGGPIFSGPQLQPWSCQPGAIDSQCNQAPSYSWLYLSNNPAITGLQPYNPARPPADVATTKTEQGVSVPFIVRLETGYQDRSQYQIAVLYQPALPWTAVNPQTQFGHKLLVTHGSVCGVTFGETNSNSVISDGQPSQTNATDSVIIALGKGYAVMSTALANSNVDCDVAIQAESLVMAKEHLIDNYGILNYTIGIGCSGGSLAEQTVQNAYPGVYQGIIAACAFPDAWGTATQLADNHVLLNYFSTNQWPQQAQQAVYGDSGSPWGEIYRQFPRRMDSGSLQGSRT
jgi:hypothetical protein